MAIILSPGETRELNVAMQPIPVPPATLYGQVVDAHTGLPISGVSVILIPLEMIEVFTGSDGRYTVGGIPPGTYTVRFSHPDYQTVEY